jgi:hypothetical protein
MNPREQERGAIGRPLEMLFETAIGGQTDRFGGKTA